MMRGIRQISTAFAGALASWIAGSSPAMTVERVRSHKRSKDKGIREAVA
jgi:hypothetical protein